MTMRDRIDGVLIDSDENGFHLILSGEEREYNFTLDHGAALALTTAVASELSPWIREMRMAQATYVDPGVGGNPYPPNDPHHPEYHDTMTEVWDSREGK